MAMQGAAPALKGTANARTKRNPPLDQPSFNWLQLNEVKLICPNRLAQLSTSIWTRVALGAGLFRLRTAFLGSLALLILICGNPTNGAAGEVYDPGTLVTKLRRPVTNAYCAVPTFAVLRLSGQARALLEFGEDPLILIDNSAAQRPAYARFLLAHECCHHTRGHLAWLQKQQKKRELAVRSRPGRARAVPQTALTFWADSISHRKIELDADCCAAKQLASHQDRAGLEAAIEAMAEYGARATGAAYPAGLQRASVIRRCGGLE